MNERSVVVTGLGAVTPFGIGVPALRHGLRQGASAASLISSFDVSQLPTRFAASAPDDCQLDPLVKNQESLKTMCRAAKLGVVAAQEAVKDANLDAVAVDPYRFGVSIGTGGLGLWDSDNSRETLDLILDSVVGNGTPTLDYSKVWRNTLQSIHPLTPLKALPNMAAAHIAINYNARGVCQTISTACTSSAQAIGEAYRQIKFGVADVMIAGGCDSMVNPNGLVAFSVLGVLSKNNEHYKTAARPFDKRRDGFMLGEGGAVFLVEEREHWGMHLTPEAPRSSIRALEDYSRTLGSFKSASPSGFKVNRCRPPAGRNERRL